MAKFNPKPFGKYFLIDKLATGGMAEIYKAKTFGVDGFEKLLAIKRILPHCSADKEFINMLIDEAKLSVLLSHTNIVQVYDLGKVGDDYFISMEFINGVNLREFLNRLNDQDEKFPEELVTYIISEVCKGLDYAHSKKDSDGNPLNIVHRDISPQNILLSYEGEVKIVDFGIAKAAMNISHTMAGILKGKISYMSPEQALGKPIDRQTDIFSTGLMFYELLTGEKFFRGETQFEVLKKIRTTRINENSFDDKFSDQVKKILAKALSYSVKERYDTAGDMQIDLTRYLYTTYADFTPRKLSNLMRKVFASEIKTKKAKETKSEDVEPQTRSILVSSKDQENIVHRERGSDQTITGTGKQSTHTFIESFISGKDEGEAEPSITRTRQGAEPPPPPPPTEPDEEITGQMAMPPPEEEEETAPPTVAEVGAKPKKPTPWGKILAPIAAVLFIGAGIWSYYGTDWFRGAPPPPSEPKIVGSLNVQSVPDGAKIFINEKETEFTTPAVVPNLAVEEPLKITLKKPKHKEWTKTLTLTDPNPVNINPTLEVIPVGTIKVSSTPPGAKILIDGEDTGKVTPTTLEDLPLSQTYNMKLELEKHRPIEQKITLYSIDPIEFDKKLEEIKYGSVKVTTSPSGAKVYLNNNDTGKTTPTTIEDLEVGKRYTFKLARNGYRDAFRSVDIEKEGTTNIRGTLSKIPEKPKEEAQTVKQKLDEAAKKLQELEKEKAAELAKQREREAQRKKEQEQAKKEQPKETPKEKEATPAKVAYVSVGSSPKGADVFINGVKRGRAPGKFKVDSGKPTEITISKSGLSTVTRVVTVRPGETRSLGTIKLGGSGKASDAAGIIVIDSNPPGAMVLMNGTPQRATPLRIKGLRPGQNITFTVKKDGYKSWSRSVTVGEGSKSFMANLKKN